MRARSVLLLFAFSFLLAPAVQAADVPFGPEETITAIEGASDITAGDLNGDGAPDVFGIGDEMSDLLRYALNGDDGSSWAVTNLPDGSRPRQTDVGDLDGDGDLDLVYSNWDTREVLWIENDLDGTGAFLTPQRIVQLGRPDGVFVADVDGDTVVEPDETFTVSLGTPSNSSVSASDGTGQGTIQNDDAASVAISDVSQAEGDAGTTDFLFTVTLSGDVAGGFTLDSTTADGSATIADGDYLATADTLTFDGTAGETQAVAVEVVGDLVVEGDETFTVDLATPSNPDVTVTDGSGLGTLVNDDGGPIFELTKKILDYDSGSDHVHYLLQITNIGSAAQGDDPASNELEDVLPDGLELLSADSDSPTFAVVADLPSNTVLGNGSIGAGETVVILLSAGVTAAPGDEVSNQALARYDADNDGINDTTIVSDDPSTPEPDDATILLVVADALEIPTLGEWGRLLLVLLLGAAAVQRLRRRPWKVA